MIFTKIAKIAIFAKIAKIAIFTKNVIFAIFANITGIRARSSRPRIPHFRGDFANSVIFATPLVVTQSRPIKLKITIDKLSTIGEPKKKSIYY